VVSFAGNFFVVMVLVYIPLCYNVGKVRECGGGVQCKGIEAFNYLLSGAATVFFFLLFYSQLFQVFV